jgi:hypothetical protein
VALETLFNRKSAARRMQLRREMSSLAKDPSESMTAYVARASGIRREINASGTAFSEEELVEAMLAGLPREYGNTVEAISIGSITLTLDTVMPKLIDAESRVQRRDKEEAKAFTVKPAAPHVRHHVAQAALQHAQKPKQKRVRNCYRCNSPKHLIKDCPHPPAESEQRGGGRGGGSAQLAVAWLASSAESAASWVVDSGASEHITNNLALLSDVREPTAAQRSIRGLAGSLTVRAVGTAVLGSEVKGSMKQITLRNVMYVPEAPANLLSVPKAPTEAVQGCG